jgi:hypothetical protein
MTQDANRNAPLAWHFCYAGPVDTTICQMRHLLLPIGLCTMLAACATTPPPPPPAVGTFTLATGQQMALAPDLIVQLDGVEDSRCPPGVQCIWAGKLAYRFSIRQAQGAPDSFELTPTEPAAAPALLGGRRIVLDTAALPAPPLPGASPDQRATYTIVPPNPDHHP